MENSGDTVCSSLLDFLNEFCDYSIRECFENDSKKKKRTFTAQTLFSFKTPYICTRTRIYRATGSSHPQTSARTRVRTQVSDPSAQSTRIYTHTRATTRRDDKERALATSNAATASACAPLYVSQGRHVRLRTTYLYLCRFVRDRPDARTFPSAEIGRSTSRVPTFYGSA